MIRQKIFLFASLIFPLVSLAQSYSNIDFARQISEKDLKKNVKALCSDKMQEEKPELKAKKTQLSISIHNLNSRV